MKSPQPPHLNQLIVFLSIAVIALFSAVRVVEYNPNPWWGWVVAFAIGTAILGGPVMWTVRDRLPEEWREDIAYGVGGIALLCVPVVLGLGLIFGNLLAFIDVGVLGSSIGLAIALLIEKMVVPERLQGTTQ